MITANRITVSTTMTTLSKADSCAVSINVRNRCSHQKNQTNIAAVPITAAAGRTRHAIFLTALAGSRRTR